MRSAFPALLLVSLLGCASAQRPPIDPIAERFKYKIDFDRGKYEAVGKDSVDVIEVWGTRPEIEEGGDYLVLGRYTLQSADRGQVFFYMTADNWDNSGIAMDLQNLDVTRGTGTFVLHHEKPGPGWFHVILHADDKEVANLYFGKGQTLLTEEPPLAFAR
jgi:hypothetical protein